MQRILWLALVASTACSPGDAPRVADRDATPDAVGASDAADGSAAPDVGAEPFVADETRLGDPSVGYFSVEISPDMRFMVWQESTGGVQGPVWSCALDPVDASLDPPDGRGFRLDNIPFRAAPQWGVDDRGAFFVTVDAAGRLLVVRPSGARAANVETLGAPADTSRVYPYPTRIATRRGALIAFLANDAMGRPQIHVLDTNAPDRVRALTAGRIDFNGTAPSFVVTVYRWFPGTSELLWGFNDGAGRLQIRAVDLTNPDAQPVPVTDEGHDHIDAFPGVVGGERVLVGGIDSTDVGAVYTRDQSSGMFRIARRIEPRSSLGAPMMAASFEPFDWAGRRYASFLVLDGGRTPSMFPAEIWITDLDGGLLRRISPARTLNRMDPEYFLGRDEAFVLYYARDPRAPGFGLYRARTGLRRGGGSP